MQAWLLSQGRCVGCGQPLIKGIQKTVKDQITVTCKCGRIFIKTSNGKKSHYRRALFSEV